MKKLYKDNYNIIEFSQICPIFINDESRSIGNVIINGELYEAIDKSKFFLYKANHTYILPDGTINVTYDYIKSHNINGYDNSIFLPGTVLKTNFNSGGSGKYALSCGNVTLYNDDTFIREVHFNFTN